MRRALVSLFVVGAVVAAAVGVTRAVFTDREVSQGNVLGVEDNFTLVLDGENNAGNRIGSLKKLFNVSNLVPGGEPAVAYLEIKNASDMPMIFRVYADNVSDNPTSEGRLRDKLHVKATLNPTDYPNPYLDGDLYGSPGNVIVQDVRVRDIIGTAHALDNISAAFDYTEPLESGYVAVYKLEVWLELGAGNAFQGEELTGDLVVDATQYDGQTESSVLWN